MISLMGKQLLSFFQQMRMRSIKNNTYILFLMFVLNIRKKIGTKISAIQIIKPFFGSQSIEYLQGNSIKQNYIRIEYSMLIASINIFKQIRSIISKQSCFKIRWRIFLIWWKKLFTRNIGKIQIIYHTKSSMLIESKNMFTCLITISLEKRIEDFFVQNGIITR